MVSRGDLANDDDGDVLYRLANKGVDLTAKREIEFTCWAGNQRAGENIVEDLVSYGYRSTVFADDGATVTGDVSVYASIMMLPDHELLLAEQNRLNAILKFHGTSCDGWVIASS